MFNEKIQKFNHSYLDFGVELSAHSNALLSTVFTDARMNSKLWFSAYVSDAQVSRIIAPITKRERRRTVLKNLWNRRRKEGSKVRSANLKRVNAIGSSFLFNTIQSEVIE